MQLPERTGLILLGCAVLFNAWYAAPEVRINRIPLNDLVLHITASERMAASFERREPFLDAWVSEWALGYPVWRSYQPLPHVAGAVVLKLFRGLGDPAAIFSVFYYLLLITFPISVYIGARLLGLPPPAAGLAALLSFASSATGDPGRYGLSYGAFVWRGSGLYTQLFALPVMAIAIGMSARALDTGERRTRVLAGILLALTALSHIIFGYAAFVCAALLAVVGPGGRRAVRLVRLATIVAPSLLLLAWFLIPLVLSQEIVNHSRWEPAVKWDSYGAPFILRELFSGRLLDFGRPPLLSILLAVGCAGAIVFRKDSRSQRLLALCGVWLVLFFGRDTWGHLLVLAGVPADLPLHRLEAVFELSAILLGAYGLERLIVLAAKRSGALAVTAVAAIAIPVIWIGIDRAAYMDQSAIWGEETLAAYEKERPDLDAMLASVRAILAQRPGRVSGGRAATWGAEFKLGSVPIYGFLDRHGLEQTDFLYHAMSKASDVMVERDENSQAQNVAFGIRAVVAPANRPMPQYLRRRSVHGRFAVYESSPEGYFGLVQIAGHYIGPPETNWEPSSAWLRSPLQPSGLVISLDSREPKGPALHRWDPLPAPLPSMLTLRGGVLDETKTGEVYQARIGASQPGYALIKITWTPDLTATVDGQPAPVIHVTPGFGAVAIPAGIHQVTVAYNPGLLKPFLFVLGIGAFALVWRFAGRSRMKDWEALASARVAAAGEGFSRPGAAVAAVLIVAGAVALHPLFRGKLIDGHDATAYPPRVVEMARAVGDGHLAPVWAPDLGAGHGQPLFQFSPPLLYWLGLLFRVEGFGLTDSLQLGLALLHLLGAAAVYGIARRLQAARYAALGGAVVWLFGPYLCVDLFVRAAFAEAAALALAPIVLFALLDAMLCPSAWRAAAGAVAVAALILSHIAAAGVLLGAFSVIVLVLGWSLRRKSFAPLISGTVLLASGVGLSAYFWIPFLAGLHDAHIDRFVDPPLWRTHILEPFQLLWSRWGYGLSVAGPADEMSFDLGPAHFVLAIAGLIVLMRSQGGTRKTLGFTFSVIALGGAWLTTDWSSWIWSHALPLQYLQLPWRALVIPGLFLPILAVFALERVGYRWAVVLVALLAAINLPHTEPRRYLTYDEEYYSPESLASKGINTTTFEEFEPRWVERRPPYDPRPLVGLAGPVDVTTISSRSASHEFRVRAQQVTLVESSIFYYPGWTLTVDGLPADIKPVAVRGTILFSVPPGEHRVTLELRATPARTVGMLLSLAILLLLGAWAAREYRQSRGA